MKTRLDAELVRRGLARSREAAIDLIAAGKVLVTGMPAAKLLLKLMHKLQSP
jgi:23S rRNA (cytidine1920-2'-O)/16S rRNA (cytidine1409-2'-O)-methyltransferase